MAVKVCSLVEGKILPEQLEQPSLLKAAWHKLDNPLQYPQPSWLSKKYKVISDYMYTKHEYKISFFPTKTMTMDSDPPLEVGFQWTRKSDYARPPSI